MSFRKSLWAVLITALVLSCTSEKETSGISGRYAGTQTFGIGQVGSVMILQLQQSGTSLTGSVTPPFRSDTVPIRNGRIEGNGIRFDAVHGGLTFHYEAVLQADRIAGSFGPIGCIFQSSGEACVTDSDGAFNLTRQ